MCSILVVDDHADTRCVIAELVGMISATIEREAPTPVLPAKAFWPKPPHADLIADIHQYCDAHRDS